MQCRLCCLWESIGIRHIKMMYHYQVIIVCMTEQSLKLVISSFASYLTLTKMFPTQDSKTANIRITRVAITSPDKKKKERIVA